MQGKIKLPKKEEELLESPHPTPPILEWLLHNTRRQQVFCLLFYIALRARKALCKAHKTNEKSAVFYG